MAKQSGWTGRRVLFLSGTPGDARRYRCDYQAEQLRVLGARAIVVGLESGDLPRLLRLEPELLILHRVGWTPLLGRFFGEARLGGSRLVYDSDDLVFDEQAAELVEWPLESTPEQRRELFDAQRQTLRICDAATFSTEPLAAAAERLVPVAVTPDVVGLELVREADDALAETAGVVEGLHVAYLSGTPTHYADFAQAADAVVEALDHYQELRFLAVGYLTLDERFDRFGTRVQRLPFQPGAALLRLLSRAAVNLAPLEPGNAFAQAKSASKYLEAALVGTPTIASSAPDFVRMIRSGENGLLAASPDDWSRELRRLIEDPELRLRLGTQAASDVRATATTAAAARLLGLHLDRLLGTTWTSEVTSAAAAPEGVQASSLNHEAGPAEIRCVAARLDWAEHELALQRQELVEARLAAAEADDLRYSLETLERELRAVRAEADAAMRSIGEIQATVSWNVTQPLRALRRLRPAPQRRQETTVTLGRAAVLFVTGAPEVSVRYRCDHQAEQIRLRGGTATVVRHGEVDLVEAADSHELVVLHRVAWGDDVEALVNRAHASGKRVVFDTDDLVFEPAAIGDVAALEDMSPDELELYEEGVHRYRATLERCDAVTTSTDALAEHARRLCDEVVVTPNLASVEMVQAAERALRRRGRDDGVLIGYLSGTNTHKKDFRVAAPGVLETLRSQPDARLRVVGPMELDDTFDGLDDRVERLPFQSWSRLVDVQAAIDVNLAPLEPHNAYTDAKSAVKWIEAGLVEVPTVASPRRDFRRVIRDGENGLLAEGPQEWVKALESLTQDTTRRRRLGRTARSDILSLHTTTARAAAYEEQLRALSPPTERLLTVNWVMFSPIVRNSGGYRNVFRIAERLGERGHVQRIVVNPVGHLAGKSLAAIRKFLQGSFGIPAHGELVVGHQRIPEADVSIATYWPTAYTVAEHSRSLFKAYFIQDLEAEFYAENDPEFTRVLGSYRLPLRHICLGRNLQLRLQGLTGLPAETVDFALDPVFTLERAPGVRNDPAQVLYFARPSLRRRGYRVGVEALRRLKERRPRTEIVFFGSPDAELGEVPFEFTNLGVLDARHVAEAMNGADVLLTFSLTNISNVPYEGMACGCAVVDVDRPNVSTMVEPDTCLLAEFDPGALAAAMQDLVDNPELRARLGENGSRSVRTRTWERTATMFEEALLRTRFVGAGGRAAT